MVSSELRDTFLAECRELLEHMETALLAADDHEIDAETINAVFRDAHTIKGSAGLFGVERIVVFTHVVESVLAAIRDGSLTLGKELVSLLLACADHIGTLVDLVETDELEQDDTEASVDASLLARLRGFLGRVDGAPVASKPNAQHPGAASEPSEHWHISLRFGRDVLKNGMDPLSFISYLGKLGTIVGISTLFDGLPDPEEMDPELCYLGFEIAFKSRADKATIEGVFEFVKDDCTLRILPPASRVSEYVKLIQALPEEQARLGELLVRSGALTERELEQALAGQRAMPEPAPPLGEILVQRSSVRPEVVEAALVKQRRVKEVKTQESRTIRVDSDKLDHLINLVGELIISAASTDMIARRARVADLEECTATLTSLVQNVRDSALQLRMVKIGATLNRFQRVVHDVAHELGKDISLVVTGEETELDKTVVEQIADPLTHLVRNAIDHGIELAEVRRARGKPAKGTIRLNAYHDSGSIVIEVSDDGGGLKRDKILSKAIERGLVEPGQSLSDERIFGLIFEPGFSTADQVTNLSGRGVGMDVVKRNITALRGSVTVRSEEGVGTTVMVRLPLTLAIIDGFLVGLGKSMFVVPLEMIDECVEFSVEPGRDYTNLRGHVLPFIRLRELFAIEGDALQRENIVVVSHGGQKAGLVVDTLHGEFQTVIKPLSKVFSRVKCISGSSILGNGEVALILDVPTLVRQAVSVSSQN